LKVAQLLISEGADKEKDWSDGLSPLYMACAKGHLEVAQLLISEGADKEKGDSDGLSPLSIACQFGQLKVAQLLISEGADKEKATSDGSTPLYIACAEGQLEVVQLLISEGADKEKASSDGCTPLYIACANGHSEVAQLLISEGCHLKEALSRESYRIKKGLAKIKEDIKLPKEKKKRLKKNRKGKPVSFAQIRGSHRSSADEDDPTRILAEQHAKALEEKAQREEAMRQTQEAALAAAAIGRHAAAEVHTMVDTWVNEMLCTVEKLARDRAAAAKKRDTAKLEAQANADALTRAAAKRTKREVAKQKELRRAEIAQKSAAVDKARMLARREHQAQRAKTPKKSHFEQIMSDQQDDHVLRKMQKEATTAWASLGAEREQQGRAREEAKKDEEAVRRREETKQERECEAVQARRRRKEPRARKEGQGEENRDPQRGTLVTLSASATPFTPARRQLSDRAPAYAPPKWTRGDGHAATGTW
jgi:hypothetical protein